MPINSRIDYNTRQTFTEEQIYACDLSTSFEINPITGDLITVTNQVAIGESIRNIVQTFITERPYSSIGSNIYFRVFENASVIQSVLIKEAVSLAIQNFEPRAKISKIDVQLSLDNNYYTVDIYFSTINNTAVQSVSIIIAKNR